MFSANAESAGFFSLTVCSFFYFTRSYQNIELNQKLWFQLEALQDPFIYSSAVFSLFDLSIFSPGEEKNSF